MSKYDSLRDELLHRLTLAGWSDNDGDVEAPTGYFSALTISFLELEDAKKELGTQDDPYFNYGTLVGSFLITEDSQGFVTVEEFPSEATLIQKLYDLSAEYSEWEDDKDA